MLENAMTPMPRILQAAAMVTIAMCLPTPRAVAQVPADVVGSWLLVSLTVTRSGSEVELLGPHPEGKLIFGRDGRYVLVGVRADLLTFVSGNRLSGTAEENERIVQGTVAQFGSYSVEPAAQVIVFHAQKSIYPNWDGAVQRRPFTVVGDRLTYITPGNFGYGASKVVWQREK
jgi:hypothetical protein